MSSSTSSSMTARGGSRDLPAYFEFVSAERAITELGLLCFYPQSENTKLYKTIWGHLLALRVPGHHLPFLAAIIALQALYEGSNRYEMTGKMLDHPFWPTEIKALRESLPRLPSELNVVLGAHKQNTTCATVCIPSLPVELDIIINPDNELASKMRLTLKDSSIAIEDAIMPTAEQMTSLRAMLPSIPDYLGSTYGISFGKMKNLLIDFAAIASKLESVRNVKSYEAWFVVRNALCLMEGIHEFHLAVTALEDSEVKFIYLEFLGYFIQAAHPNVRP